MRKTGKKFLAAKAKVEARPYGLGDAMNLGWKLLLPLAALLRCFNSGETSRFDGGF